MTRFAGTTTAAAGGARVDGIAHRERSRPSAPGNPLVLYACAALFALALFLGGGTQQGLWSDAIVQIAALPVLALAVSRLLRERQRPLARSAYVLLAAAFLLPLLQLVPLPPFIWTSLPHRSPFALAYTSAGIAVPWLGISLDPGATWRALVALIPAAAIFLATLLLGRRQRRLLVVGVIAFSFVSVVLGLAQLAGGPQSPLRFFTFTHRGEAVGFFANRNHLAALLYSAIPLAAAIAASLAANRRQGVVVGAALAALVLASLFLGLGIARSRAGLGLGVLAVFGSVAMTIGAAGRRPRGLATLLIYAGGAIGVALVLQFAALRIMQRFEVDPVDDLRWHFAAVTLQAARDFFPFGSGFGTFSDIYRIYELPADLRFRYVNHTHDDFIELLLEGGAAAVALLMAFAVWFLLAARKAWTAAPKLSADIFDTYLPRAATIVICLLLCHSVLDYPLRTTAISSIFAFACALLIPPLRTVPLRRRRERTQGKPSGGSARAAFNFVHLR
jgi:O-antigen ligase